MVRKEATMEQVKLEALDIASSITDTSITSASAPPAAKKVKGLAGILKKVIQDEHLHQLNLLFSMTWRELRKKWIIILI